MVEMYAFVFFNLNLSHPNDDLVFYKQYILPRKNYIATIWLL